MIFVTRLGQIHVCPLKWNGWNRIPTQSSWPKDPFPDRTLKLMVRLSKGSYKYPVQQKALNQSSLKKYFDYPYLNTCSPAILQSFTRSFKTTFVMEITLRRRLVQLPVRPWSLCFRGALWINSWLQSTKTRNSFAYNKQIMDIEGNKRLNVGRESSSPFHTRRILGPDGG